VDILQFDNLDAGPFLPPRLGRRVRDDRQSAPRSHRPPDEAWRETPARFDGCQIETKPEAAVFSELRRDATRGSWVQPILGEPGAGKSRLLREWAGRLISEGSPVALIPLHRSDVWDIGGDLAARLTRICDESAAALGLPAAPSAPADGRRVWLLDGLDEVPDAAWSAGLGAALTALPGAKIVTCRTAVFEGRRAGLGEGVGAAWRPTVEVQPLDRNERRAFLSARLPAARAGELAAAIEASEALRELAGSPLLLGLMAMLGIPLPTARAAFYEQAETELARRRHIATETAVWSRARSALDDLAERMTLDRVEAPAVLLHEVCDEATCAALRAGGLIRVAADGGSFSFLHLTFQEHHLARRLSAKGLDAALDAHWRDPRYEETLALTLASTVGNTGAEAGAKALDRLVERGLSSLRDDPDAFLAAGRSPTRLALHLLKRSGTDADVWPLMQSLAPLKDRPIAFRLAIAADPRSPAVVLEELAGDADENVRMEVAGNPATLVEALCRLAGNANVSVRMEVAGNPATPAEALSRLAGDAKTDVRRKAARNAATPVEALCRLAENAEEDVRMAVAGNATTPAEALSRLAGDAGKFVRRAVAGNATTPVEVLSRLAGDAGKGVRQMAAGNAATPVEALSRLAGDADKYVRWAAAGNPATPVEALSRFAGDKDKLMRWAEAGNAATPVEALSRLAGDADKLVRRAAAGNAATPAEALSRLAGDAVENVRRAAAGNAATPAEALSRLAGDAKRDVRMAAARNTETPVEALSLLAGDVDEGVRMAVAGNPTTPAKALPRLAGDADGGVRRKTAGNAATPAEALSRLADDGDWRVRMAVARSAATPAKALIRLAGDALEDVRRTMAGNVATPVEALSRLVGDADEDVQKVAAKNPALPLEAVLAPSLMSPWRRRVARGKKRLRSLLPRRRAKVGNTEAVPPKSGGAGKAVEEGFWRAAGGDLWKIYRYLIAVVVILALWFLFPEHAALFLSRLRSLSGV